jgi:uncharacterized protein YjbI with pentapeptide repeats
MANQEHLDILAKGVAAWNDWRKENPQIDPDLGKANLREAKLPEVDLRRARLVNANLYRANVQNAMLNGAQLHKANLCQANLRETVLRLAKMRAAYLRAADLYRADLQEANLNGVLFSEADLTLANLKGAVLRRADLTQANLSRARLSLASFRETDLTKVDFSGAVVAYTTFASVDLSTAKGLEAVLHGGPSTIGIDTIYRSHGSIPETFLRGAGVSEKFIAFMKSLKDADLEFYSCFISFSIKDQPFADRLYADLQSSGVRSWFAPRDIQGGRKIHEQIDEAIRVYDKLLLILSDASMNSSWVKTEIANARAREDQQKRQMLFPITLVPFGRIKDWKLFDADRGIDTAREIREYFIPDFSNWKDHDSYQKAFDGLLRDLRAEARDGASA